MDYSVDDRWKYGTQMLKPTFCVLRYRYKVDRNHFRGMVLTYLIPIL